MQISRTEQQSNAKNKRPTYLAWLAAALVLAGLVWIVIHFSSQNTLPDYVIFCDAEKVQNDLFIGENGDFKNGQTQSPERARSGKFSCKTGEGEGLQFGFSIDLDNIESGSFYKASVWRYQDLKGNDGYLAVAADDGKSYYKNSAYPIDRDEKGWEKIEIEFFVPATSKWNKLNIHTYSGGNTVVYFDDIRFEKLPEGTDSTFTPTAVNLSLRPEAMGKIKAKRKEALENGLLVSSEDDWVKAKFWEDGQENPMDAKIRLKGDWLDHLQGSKWSFRVKMKDPNSWNRMMTFSLQTPAARYFLHEWVFHQMLEREDILTTRYDFVNLTVNGEPWGIYAYEEHFEKQLVEYRNRREGPIVKFTEDGFWAHRRRFINQFGYLPTDLEEQAALQSKSEVVPFAEGATMKNPKLANLFERAQDLMYQYRNGVKPVKEVFDIDRLAKFIALSETLGAVHGLVWHNQRFYYNPVTDRLEPIGFDGFVEAPYPKFYFIGQGTANGEMMEDGNFMSRIFQDEEFAALYFKYLYKFTSRDYLNPILDSLQVEMSGRLKVLKSEFPEYYFDKNRTIEIAQFTNALILPFEQSLKAFTQDDDGVKKSLKISNGHSLPLEVIGYGGKNDVMTGNIDPVVLPAQHPRSFWFRTSHPKGSAKFNSFSNLRELAATSLRNIELRKFKDIEVPSSAKYLFFKTLGVDSVFSSPILKWSTPGDFSPSHEMFSSYPLRDNAVYFIEKDKVIFNAGQHTITEPIVIPEGFSTIIPGDVTLDFIKSAFFLTKGPVFLNGKADAPIHIASSDGTARGFTIMNAGEVSKVAYTTFEGFNTLSYKGWNLTGAVTFYESDVDLFKTNFIKNHCEDGLNVIRSEFLMKDCVVSQTAFDGFDCDFCKGEIRNSSFIKTGNDGMDFSGSSINVHNSRSINCGDKGLSVGEESQVVMFDSEIRGCPIGVASKDLSVLVIDKLNMEDCEIGFTAYQKKPEYGQAKIIVKEYTGNNLKRLYQLAPGSTLQLEDKLIEE
ncbi:MAG: right-handed parallel beta-helix repeat-containing protein [Saprospiraceae bacterium]|nr:right-handed parallel beta-helix repeat-containing protein [Saprospiraceae bacterium]